MPSSRRRLGFELFFASFAALLLELALIRWLPERVRVVAYFPNLILIAAFLGLGVGALTQTRKTFVVGALILAIVLVGIGLGRIAFTANGTSEHLWLLYYDLPQSSLVVDSVVLPISIVFLATTFLFIPLGGAIAGRLQQFKTLNIPLDGYLLDLTGSLVGVIGFMILAATCSRPIWWFAGAAGAIALSLPKKWKNQLAFAVPVLLALYLLQAADRAAIYSPYYAISTVSKPNGDVVVLANGSLHQQALDLRASALENSSDDLRQAITGYRLPVARLSTRPMRALVVGAGTGNDVTVLLDAGVPEVHAVEIDPIIIELGRTSHPAHPYLDPRVVVHNTDARAFLESTQLTFDLIVFGTLDSMTRLSALSNVRLDNFVYTLECLQMARRHLSPRGGLALMFMASKPEIRIHLFNLLSRAFDERPTVYNGKHFLFNQIYFAGPGYHHLLSDRTFSDQPRLEINEQAVVPTDDWPYLYLSKPQISPFYFGIAGMVLLTAIIFLFGSSSRLRRALLRGEVDWEMMLLGAAFLLCETGFVTQMNLLFGATWRTSAVIFAAILAALIGSTLIGRKRTVGPRIALALGIASLVATAYLPLRQLAPEPLIPRVGFAILACGTPLVFFGLVFASRFAARKHTDIAFGWNILGAVFGGILETGSMLLGLRAVLIGAAMLYAIAFLLIRRRANPPIPVGYMQRGEAA